MQAFVKKLNGFYQKHRALYEIEDSWDGFAWLNVDDCDNSGIAFMRSSGPWRGKVQQIVSVTNFTPVVHYDYQIAMPQTGLLREILNSDDPAFGGSGVKNLPEIRVTADPFNGKDASARITLPPLATVYFMFDADQTTRKQGD